VGVFVEEPRLPTGYCSVERATDERWDKTRFYANDTINKFDNTEFNMLGVTTPRVGDGRVHVKLVVVKTPDGFRCPDYTGEVVRDNLVLNCTKDEFIDAFYIKKAGWEQHLVVEE